MISLIALIIAGLPATTQKGGTSLDTTALAPMIAPSPIVTPARIATLSPIHTLLPIRTGPFEKSSLSTGGILRQEESDLP